MLRLIAQNQGLLAAEQRRSRQLALVTEVSRNVAASLDLDQVLGDTVDLVSSNFGVDQVSIHLLDQNDETNLFMAASSRSLEQFLETPRITLGRGMIGWVAQHGVPRLANDADEDPVFFRAPGLNTAAELALPLKAGGKVIGVLNLESDHKDAFAPEDVPILETLADQVAIAIQNSRLAAQARELAVAEERNHMARELHDDTVQRLAALHRQLDLLEEDLDDGHEVAVKERLHVVQEMVQESMRNVRNLSRRLRPALLEELGLVPALEALVADIRRDKSCNSELRFEWEGEPRRFKPNVELVVYRISQEALTNAFKHAHAGEMVVTLRLGEDLIDLSVRDNGQGFSTARCATDGKPVTNTGMGLIGMRERARSIGATLRLESTIGQGTTVRLLVPLSAPNQE
jgi:signal transduction histidine kinase